MPDPDILDPDTVATLRSYEQDGILTLAELTDVFLRDITDRDAAIEQAIQTSNPEDLERAAHALKGAAGNVGAFVVREICQQLEDLGKSGTTAGAENLYNKLKTEIPRVENVLKNLSNNR